MIVDMLDTSTTAVNKKLDELREKAGVVTMGRVGTLIIKADNDALLEESIEAANAASHEHPSRVLVVTTGNADAAEARLDAQIRVGGDAGAGEVVVLTLSGPLADHAEQRRHAVPASRHPGGGMVARCRPGGARARPVGQVGDSAHHRCDQWRGPAVGHQEPAGRIHRRRHRSGLGPYHLLAGAARFRGRPEAARADRVGAGLRTEDGARARHPGGLAGQPHRRAGAPGGRRAQGRAGTQKRDHHPEPAAGGHDGHPEPDGPAGCPGSVGAQGNP